ncbi:MAG: hypothetical protein GC164_09385 [Phycisphaera sp.]|nr:hypothetical protein [Phycisphaera sp.]
MLRHFLCLLILPFAVTFLTSTVHAQVMAGPWVDKSEQRIAECRMGNLHVLVLDAAGQPVANQPVRIKMLRHAFAFGFQVSPLQPDAPYANNAPVWRCFNSVALDKLTEWSRIEPVRGGVDDKLIESAVRWGRSHGLIVRRWGGLFMFDAGHTPGWVAELSGNNLFEACKQSLRDRQERYGSEVNEWDLTRTTGDVDYITSLAGQAGVRGLCHALRAEPSASSDRVYLRFDDALDGQGVQTMVQRLSNLGEAFVPYDGIAITATLAGTVVPTPLERTLEWLEPFAKPVVIAGLSVTGSSPQAAANNLETALRVLFASPNVAGIYLTGVQAPHTYDAASALIGESGEPTPAGLVFDGLIHDLWWTDTTLNTDELGNVRTRVFAGDYSLKVALPEGDSAEMVVRVPVSAVGEQAALMVVQPIKKTPD